jgi:hypothetical protein
MDKIWAALFLMMAIVAAVACTPVDTTHLDQCENMRGGHRAGNCY